MQNKHTSTSLASQKKAQKYNVDLFTQKLLFEHLISILSSYSIFLISSHFYFALKCRVCVKFFPASDELLCRYGEYYQHNQF